MGVTGGKQHVSAARSFPKSPYALTEASGTLLRTPPPSPPTHTHPPDTPHTQSQTQPLTHPPAVTGDRKDLFDRRAAGPTLRRSIHGRPVRAVQQLGDGAKRKLAATLRAWLSSLFSTVGSDPLAKTREREDTSREGYESPEKGGRKGEGDASLLPWPPPSLSQLTHTVRTCQSEEAEAGGRPTHTPNTRAINTHVLPEYVYQWCSCMHAPAQIEEA